MGGRRTRTPIDGEALGSGISNCALSISSISLDILIDGGYNSDCGTDRVLFIVLAAETHNRQGGFESAPAADRVGRTRCQLR